MDDYKSNFMNKLIYVKMMTNMQGQTRFPVDWFEVAVAVKSKEDIPESNKGMHSSGTSFNMKSLLEMYKTEFKEFLEKNKISYSQDARGITFKSIC